MGKPAIDRETDAAASAASASSSSSAASAASASSAANAYASADNANAFAAFAAAFAAAAAARAATYAVWEWVSSDASALEDGVAATDLASQRLWPETPPSEIAEHWNTLKDYLLAQQDEDWIVWTDWYEARLRGDAPNPDLEYAKAMIPNDIWDQGPKIANAEIRRLMKEHAPKPAVLEASISPQPVLKNNKADVQPNDPVDTPEPTDKLLTLPDQQRTVIRVLVQSLRTNKNFDMIVVGSLEEYGEQLRKSGTRPALGTLDQMHQAVRDEYLQLNREKYFDAQRGLRRHFLSFFANHKAIKAHFPLDEAREADYRATEVDPENLNRTDLTETSMALDAAVRDALQADAVTPDYLESVEHLTQAIRRVAEMPPITRPLVADGDELSWREMPEIPWWKRAVIRARSFAGASLSVVASVASLLGFTETKIAKALWEALKAFKDALFAAAD